MTSPSSQPGEFNPAAFAALGELGERLRELAGDAAYRAGRDYLRSGALKDGVVTGARVSAIVTGSTEYRVAITIEGTISVSCSCPAHRRNRYCKHVVAVGVALNEQPRLFAVVAPADIPVIAPPPKKRRDGSTKRNAEALKVEQRAAGLALVDRLLDGLAAGGVVALGQEQQTLLAAAADAVRGLKLRHLGNRLMALHQIAASNDGEEAAARFAARLRDIAIARWMLGAHFDGSATLEPGLADELLGKTWREKELERVAGLDLLPLAREEMGEGDFRVESLYLIDLASGQLYVEREITPRGLRGKSLPRRRLRVLVDDAALYPGDAPRRIKLATTRDAPLAMEHVERCLALATADAADIRRLLTEHLGRPFSRGEPIALFRPAALDLTGGERIAHDRVGRKLPLIWPAAWTKTLPGILPHPSDPIALLGRAELGDEGPRFRCLAIVGPLRWPNGPAFPDMP